LFVGGMLVGDDVDGTMGAKVTGPFVGNVVGEDVVEGA
jgi:hypothetical protein